jgi:hypothetical protein
MLTRGQKIGLALSAVGVLFFIASFFFPPNYQVCHPGEYTHAKECASHYLGPFIVFWTVAAIDAHNGLVTALATVVMAAFTGTLWLVTGNAVHLAREEFVATHRPKIVTRSFEAATSDGSETVAFAFVNVGVSDAKIVEIGCCVTENSDPGKIIEREAGFFPFDMASGDKRQHFVTNGRIAFANAGKVGAYLHPDLSLYLIGYIKYLDALGRARETGFCRKFNTANARWVRQSQSEYEYED